MRKEFDLSISGSGNFALSVEAGVEDGLVEQHAEELLDIRI